MELKAGNIDAALAALLGLNPGYREFLARLLNLKDVA
jgi:hypothetical protein